MRDLSNSQVFIAQLESLVRETSEKHSELLSRLTPNESRIFENHYSLNEKRLLFYIRTAIISWYIPEEYGFLLRLEIEERIRSNEDIFWIQILLDSKASMLLFLLETQRWHARDFFGNVLNENLIVQVLKRIKPRYKNVVKPKSPEYRRGYRDHGNLKFPHEVHELGDFRREQMDLESERQDRKSTYLFMQGYLGIPSG